MYSTLGPLAVLHLFFTLPSEGVVGDAALGQTLLASFNILAFIPDGKRCLRRGLDATESEFSQQGTLVHPFEKSAAQDVEKERPLGVALAGPTDASVIKIGLCIRMLPL